ncbi:GTPase activating protein [Rhizoclosmatium sp. JEL0117]|nr:GTPase activating protein [Rhizoclosmatium sp. JEL0117]
MTTTVPPPNPPTQTPSQSSNQRTNRVRLIYAKPNVSKQTNESSNRSLGFLCLVSFPIPASNSNENAPPPGTNKAFAWIPKQDIHSEELGTFRRIAKNTRDLFGPNPPPSPVSPSFSSSSASVPQLSQQQQPLPSSRSSSPISFLFPSSSPSPSPSKLSTGTNQNPPSKLSISTSPLNDYISLPQSAHISPVSGLYALWFNVSLTLNIAHEEACLVKMQTRYSPTAPPNQPSTNDQDAANEGGDEEEEDFDSCWFDDHPQDARVENVVGELHVWLVKTCGVGLQPFFSSSEDEDHGATKEPGMVFLVLPISELGRSEDGKSVLPPVFGSSAAGLLEKKGRGEWPVFAGDSAVYKLGAFGFGIAKRVVGSDVAGAVEGLTRNAAWDVVEQFSRVTKFAQDTGRQVVEHPLARPVLPLIPGQIRELFLSSEEAEVLMSEYDSAQIYLANFAENIQEGVKRRLQRRPSSASGAAGKVLVLDTTREYDAVKSALVAKRDVAGRLSAEGWVMLFDEKGKLSLGKEEMRRIVYYGSVSDDCRRDVWKFLLGVYAWDSTEMERGERLKALTAQYESMKRQWVGVLRDAAENPGTPVSPRRMNSGNEAGSVGDEAVEGDLVSKLKERKNRVEKDVIRTDRTNKYFEGTAEDNEILIKSPTSPTYTTAKLSNSLEMLKNVLITYTVYNFDLGYVQGMNDLLSPILAVTDDEVEAFWCFVTWMEYKVLFFVRDVWKSNFYRDQSGMRHQLHLLELLIKFMDPFLYSHLERIDSTNLFCCFRWMLIVFKREFKFNDVITMWEAIWACPFTKHLHFFIAFAILNKHRTAIMTQCTAFDEALKFMNDLSDTQDVEDILERAEVLFHVFKQELDKAMMEPEPETGKGEGKSVLGSLGEMLSSRRGSSVSIVVDGPSEAAEGAAVKADEQEGDKGVRRAISQLSVRGEGERRERSVSPAGGVVYKEELYELFELVEEYK